MQSLYGLEWRPWWSALTLVSQFTKLLMMGDLNILDKFNGVTSSYFSFGGQFYEQTDKQ